MQVWGLWTWFTAVYCLLLPAHHFEKVRADGPVRGLTFGVPRDWQHTRASVVLQILLREGEGGDSLLLVCVQAHPQKGLESRVEEKDIIALETVCRWLATTRHWSVADFTI